MLSLPGVHSRSLDSREQQAEQERSPMTLLHLSSFKSQTCAELLELIEANGMALIEAGYPPERVGPGWAASVVLGDGEEFTMWLGDVDDAMNFEALRERGVLAIVNMAVKDCKIEQGLRIALNRECADDVAEEDKRWDDMRFDAEYYGRQLESDDVWYLGLDTEDALGYPMSEHFDELVAFLRRCREDRRSVLVHCMHGLNRAGCACGVFLMREGLAPGAEGLSLREMIDYLSRRRAGVLQNTGFLDQLAAQGPCLSSEDPTTGQPATEESAEDLAAAQPGGEAREGGAAPEADAARPAAPATPARSGSRRYCLCLWRVRDKCTRREPPAAAAIPV